MVPTQQKSSTSGLTPTLLLAVISASLGTWFPIGYSIVAMNGPQAVIVKWIRHVECTRQPNSTLWCSDVPESEEHILLAGNSRLNLIWSIASAISGFGGLIAVLVCATLVNRLGPKTSLLVTAAVITVGITIFSLAPLANAYEMIIVGRLVIGFAMGMMCTITPIYSSEIAPVSVRGAMGTVPTLLLVCGFVSSTIFGLPFVLGSGTRWTILTALQLVPVAIMCIVLYFCPESPGYLYLVRKDKPAARRALIWLRRTNVVESELKALETELIESEQRERLTVFTIFRKRPLRFPLFMCAFILALPHLAGYGCVSTYSTSIITGTGLSVVNSIYASLGLWFLFLVVAIGSMMVVDRMGRRTLLLISLPAMVVSFCVMVICMAMRRQGHTLAGYGSVVSLFVYVGSYAVGLASVPFILPNEIFTQEARAAAVTICNIANWTTVLVVTFVFSAVVPLAEEYTFIAFIVIATLGAIFVYFKLPETCGRSIEDIQIMLRDRASKI